MSTSMNKNSQQEKSPVGLLLIVGDIISNEQRDEICLNLKQAFKQIDTNKYHEINDLFNNLIHENEFQTDSQYRQIANTENGSTAGFLYLPNFHTLLNVFRDLFNICYHVCIIFCGQQIDSNGAFILSDSIFTCDHFHSLFEENTSYVIEDLHIILPFVSNQWIKLSNNYLQKQLQNIRINDLSTEINQENSFGQRFYERLIQILNNDLVDFDIYTKLIPRDSSGTIAFDEPNLYILYGQQGDASLFGIRGFVVLVNGGFSRIPSYWNLIRGLQTIDACILTHFDYDVFPGLQTILHRKTIPSANDDRLCKPDIGAMFLNHIQRTKLQSTPVVKSSSTNSKLLVNLTENIDQFLSNIKQLNIDTFDLVKHAIPNKQSIEPINLYKKIAFGSLDLYLLHPTTSISEDDKVIAALKKIPIRDQQISSSIIPLHHWYSSCSLLVWTPTSKSSKDSLVRILYTGACPQTLVFEALDRVRHLEFLHESQLTTRTSYIKTTPSANVNVGVKHPPEKPKVSPPLTNRVISSTIQNKTKKLSPHPNISKPKIPQTTTRKLEKPPSTSSAKKTPPSTASGSTRSSNKDKKTPKSHEPASKTSSKAKQVKPHVSKLKVQNDQKPKLKVQNGRQKELETQNRHQEESETHQDHEERQGEESVIENEHKQNLETHHSEYEQSDEIEQDYAFENDNEEQTQENDEQQLSIDELNETSMDNPDGEITRPESVSLTIDHNESFFESNNASPIDEIKSQLSPHDPMTTSFIDGDPNTQNPFIENTDDHDEMEIIHHDIPTSPKYQMPSIEDIDPQGLPIEKDIRSKKSTVKKLQKGSNRTNGSSTTANNTNQVSSRPSKPTSGPIFNVDVAYIPYHGNEYYVDSEFFRRIRARYYILNAVQISRLTLEALINGKQQWDKKGHVPVTLVPTFDGEQLRQFFVINKDRLAELNITILPAAIRCNVQYDGEGSPAQLLRLNSIYDTEE